MRGNNRYRIYSPLAAAAVLLALAGPAAAQRYYGYGPIELRATILAQELAEAAKNVHRNAEGRVERMGYGSPRTLADLHALDATARSFARQVELYRSPWRAASEFRTLQRAYNRATTSFDRIPAGSYLRAELRRVGYLMQQLDAYYDEARGRGRYRWGYRYDPYRH